MRQSMVMGLIAVVLIAATGMAQSPADYAGAPPAHWHDFDNDLMKAFHNPMEGLEMGWTCVCARSIPEICLPSAMTRGQTLSAYSFAVVHQVDIG